MYKDKEYLQREYLWSFSFFKITFHKPVMPTNAMQQAADSACPQNIWKSKNTLLIPKRIFSAISLSCETPAAL